MYILKTRPVVLWIRGQILQAACIPIVRVLDVCVTRALWTVNHLAKQGLSRGRVSTKFGADRVSVRK
jgi:hypothetical protein